MGCLVHVHADVVELGLERLRIVRQRHRDIHRRAVHERLTGEVTPPPVYRDVPCPTLVDPLACSHSSGANMIFLHMLRLRLSRQPIRKHLPTGTGMAHSISRVSGPDALPAMGPGSSGKPLHAYRHAGSLPTASVEGKRIAHTSIVEQNQRNWSGR